MTESIPRSPAPAVQDDLLLPAPGERRATVPERIALRLLQFGGLAAILVVTRYASFELDRFYVPKEFVLHATVFLSGLFMLGAARRAEATRVDVLLVGFLLTSALSLAFAQNLWVAARALAISISGVGAFWISRGLRQAGLAPKVLAGLALMVTLAAVTALVQAHGLEIDYFSQNRSPGGTLGNRNSIAHLIALGLPVLMLSVLRSKRGTGFFLGVVGVLFSSWALVLTRSRAAWLGIGIALGVALLGALLAPAVRRDGGLLGRLFALVLFAGAGAGLALVVPNDLDWRSDNPYLETARTVINYREGSGAGRLVQYRTSLGVALSSPLYGVGPGNWAVEYPAFASRNDPSLNPNRPGMTMNPWPSSDWVAMVAERGIAGFAFLALALLLIALGAFRMLRDPDNEERGLDGVMLLATLGGMATVGAFDAVLLLPWPTFFFWAALGAMWSADTAPEVALSAGGRTFILLAVVLLAGLGTVRSAGQVAAMDLYSRNGTAASLEWAARLDPGNYRLRVRLVQRLRRDREARCTHARAARDLYPTASEARRLAARCD